MVVARVRGYPQVGADEGGGELGDQFLYGVGMVSEAFFRADDHSGGQATPNG